VLVFDGSQVFEIDLSVPDFSLEVQIAFENFIKLMVLLEEVIPEN
jgi:hypothetical protein